MKAVSVPLSDLYALKPRALWRAFASDNFAFWMSCCYLFFEYVRPQAIWTFLDFYPYWARSFVILAFIGWLLDRNRRFVWTKITTLVLVFQVVIILSSLNAYWPEESWDEFMTLFNWVVVFFVLTQTVTTRQRFYILLLVFLVASFKLSLGNAIIFARRGFAFTHWGLTGPVGFFQNSGELAIQMVVFGAIAYYFILGIRPYLKQRFAYFLYLMPITAAITTLGTSSRGGQLALFSVLLGMVLVAKHRFKIMLLAIFLALFAFLLLPEQQKARFEQIGNDETSQQRILYWKHGWQMIKDHPILGVGYFNFVPYYRNNHSEDIVIEHHKRELYVEVPHNIIIQVGTDAGFIGIAIFIGLIIWSFLLMRRIRKEADKSNDIFVANMCRGMNLALIGYFVAGQFVTVAYYPFLWIHLVFVTSMGTFWKNEKATGTVPVYHIPEKQAVKSAKPLVASL